MIERLKDIRIVATFLLAVFFLTDLFLKSPIISEINNVLITIALLISLLEVRGSSRIIGYLLFLISGGLLLIFRAPGEIWLSAINHNMSLVVLFTMVPLLGIPVYKGGYTEALQSFFHRYASTKNRFYLLVTVLTALIAGMVTIAATILMFEISRVSKFSKDKRLIGTAISRGFTSSLVWAPSYISVAVVIELTKVAWTSFLPFAFTFGVIMVLVGWGLNACRTRKEREGAVPGNDSPEKLDWKKIGELIFFSILLIVSIILVSAKTGISIIIVVSMVSLIFPILWSLSIKRLSAFVFEFKETYLKQRVPKLKNEVVIFMGAGFLATGIEFSRLGEYIPRMMAALVGHNTMLFSIVVMYTIILISALGIHPIIPVTIIASMIDVSAYGMSHVFFALVLCGSWAMGNSISLSTANVITMGGLLECSTMDVGLRWNILYVLILSLILISWLYILRVSGILL